MSDAPLSGVSSLDLYGGEVEKWAKSGRDEEAAEERGRIKVMYYNKKDDNTASCV